MPLKKSTGNMYPWVTHTHSHLGGECPHKCVYCYVDNPRFGRPARYQGELRLIEDEFKVNYGSGKTIFIENCNDMFAREVPEYMIDAILDHCRLWPDNRYVFQSKNPHRMAHYSNKPFCFPNNFICGTTIETNRRMDAISKAPKPESRVYGMTMINAPLFLTIEPVLDFDVDELASMIATVNPDFLNLGADSKGHGLPEPAIDKIHALVNKLREYGIELREKHNLKRLMEKSA